MVRKGMTIESSQYHIAQLERNPFIIFVRFIEPNFGNLKAVDISRLEPGEWANDELVNFSLK
jgi:hypothetical protein